MTAKMRIEGFRDIERALAALPSGTAKGVARRAMRKELKPVEDMANALWPGETPKPFRTTSKLARSQRGPRESRSVTNMFVGSNNAVTRVAHLLEFGTGPRFQLSGRFTGSVAPRAMLTPSWEAHKRQILSGLGARMWEEIRKTIERRERRAAKIAAG